MSARAGGRLAAAAAAVAALGGVAAGCRLDVEHVREGRRLPAAALAALATSSTTLDGALAALGAPDAVEWTGTGDVLVYEHVRAQRTRWELENPMTFVGQITPMAAVGELVTYTLYTARHTGRRLPTGPAGPVAAPGRPVFTTRPLRLDGDDVGREQVRLVFDRATGHLDRIEVARGPATGGVGGVARGTFLR